MSSEEKAASKGRDKTPWGEHVAVTFEDGIAWVTLNRPEKRNAMSPALNREMMAVVDALESDERCGVLVLTGEGEAFTAGMDIKEYFRETDNAPAIKRLQVKREAEEWQWRRLKEYLKPTIAMVNGWCFGGGFTPLVACDLAIADQEAIFGLSEINWGIIPGGNVTKAVADTMGHRNGLYYVMTGETFNGREAQQMGLVNEAVPKDQLRPRTKELATILLDKNPSALRSAKIAYKRMNAMDWDTSADYLQSKASQAWHLDDDQDREKAMAGFLDKKSFKPGVESFKRKD